MKPLTKETIQGVLGPVDDTLAAELVTTGASEEELIEAWAWVCNEEAFLNEGRPYPGPRAASLIEILTRWHEDEEDT